MKQEKSCGCIVLDKRTVLLIKHNSGHWDFPKGHVEGEESEVETAIREVKEETGLDVHIQKKHRYATRYMPKSDVEKEVVFFLAKKKKGIEVPQMEEVERVEWVSWEEAFEKITFDSSKELLRQAIHDYQETWDIYNEKREKTGKICIRGKEELEEGEYHLVVQGVLFNSKGEILMTKRSPKKKKHPGLWEATRGSVIQGETSLEAVCREWKEELGLVFDNFEPILYSTKKYEDRRYIKDIWVIQKDLDLHAINFRDGEVVDAKWVDQETYLTMQQEGQIVPTMDFGKTEYQAAFAKKQRESYSFLQKEVTVKIDRKMGSIHPCHQTIYPINYGYIPNTKAADGEELDAYVLGVWEPVEEARGVCIAIIHRLNDDDDKLIIAPKGKQYSNDAIRALTEFQEQYFESEIIR